MRRAEQTWTRTPTRALAIGAMGLMWAWGCGAGCAPPDAPQLRAPEEAASGAPDGQAERALEPGLLRWTERPQRRDAVLNASRVMPRVDFKQAPGAELSTAELACAGGCACVDDVDCPEGQGCVGQLGSSVCAPCTGSSGAFGFKPDCDGDGAVDPNLPARSTCVPSPYIPGTLCPARWSGAPHDVDDGDPCLPNASSAACGAPRCGDGVCEAGESSLTCAFDCAVCGDGVCDSNESLATCPDDCTECGDGVCAGDEDAESCTADCAECGDGVCEGDESARTCPRDCGACDDCACFTDADCPEGEGCVATAGASMCTPCTHAPGALGFRLDCDEDGAVDRDALFYATCVSTPFIPGTGCPARFSGRPADPDDADPCSPEADAPVCSGAVCGDGVCEGDEATTCPRDCAACGDGLCSDGEDAQTCAEDCTVCGDNVCGGDERASTCPQDCGTCEDCVCLTDADCPEGLGCVGQLGSSVCASCTASPGSLGFRPDCDGDGAVDRDAPAYATCVSTPYIPGTDCPARFSGRPADPDDEDACVPDMDQPVCTGQ